MDIVSRISAVFYCRADHDAWKFYQCRFLDTPRTQPSSSIVVLAFWINRIRQANDVSLAVFLLRIELMEVFSGYFVGPWSSPRTHAIFQDHVALWHRGKPFTPDTQWSSHYGSLFNLHITYILLKNTPVRRTFFHQGSSPPAWSKSLSLYWYPSRGEDVSVLNYTTICLSRSTHPISISIQI